MKSKSPFAIKSPLLAYKSDMTGNYANPEYVPRVNVGAAVGAHAAKTAADVFATVNEADKGKRKAAADKASGGNQNTNTVNIYTDQNTGSGGGNAYTTPVIGDTSLTTPKSEFPGGRGTTSSKTPDTPAGSSRLGYRTTQTDQANTGVSYDQSFNKLKKGNDGKALATGDFKGGDVKDWEKYVRNYNTINIDQERDEVFDSNNNLTAFSDWRKRSESNSPSAMKGSPANHNDQQEFSDQQKLGDIMKQPGGIIANAAKFMRSRRDGSAVGSIAGPQPQSSAISRAGLSISGGSTPGGAGLFGAAAQAISADAASQELLPPPNQVAESGSYAGTGDRMLEMDSNPVANQSIGRDTDIASQLFGSGQRASMLAMNGTPLHDKGHADDYEGHTHRKKGGSYKVGDYMDETDMETSYPKLYTQDVGEIKKDKKSQFMVSKNEDYNPTKIDTIRPLKGKTFKMGWGDAERNISTNPKYKKSN